MSRALEAEHANHVLREIASARICTGWSTVPGLQRLLLLASGAWGLPERNA
jgi:hypothetical protein